MSNIALIADSTTDLPEDLRRQYKIQVVPLYLIWGSEQLRDQVDIQSGKFYERLTTDPVHPKTSQPAAGDFTSAINQAAENGVEEAVIFTISSGMSATFNSADQARSKAAIPVHIVDSRANSMSLGWQVLAAARVRESGGDATTMIEAAAAVRRTLQTYLYVDTLDYLHKGGRISGLQKFIGNALNMKPLLCVNHESGSIEVGGRTRTRTKALEKMYQTFFEKMAESDQEVLRVAVLHGNDAATGEALADRIRREHNPAEIYVGMTSPVMGVHTGPGAIALCGYTAEE